MYNENPTILLVDDVELNRAILYELFHNQYRILEAENGQQALEMIENHLDSLTMVLLDIVMPILDGNEVLQILHEKKWMEIIPVIMITAENSEDTILRGYELGVSDIINKPFNPDIVKRRVENVIELYAHKHHLESMVKEQMATLELQAQKIKQTNTFVIDTLSTAVEFRNCESGLHIKRMRSITNTLLKALSGQYPQYHMDAEAIETIASAAAMHDIGKISIPDSVLLKPGKLTVEEFEIMKTHTIRGCEILQSLNYAQDEEYYRYCYEICRYHHERWDGGGYPDKLKGDEIPIWAQVVSVADVYDALTSERVYKPPYPHAEAVCMIMEGQCGVFNPKLLQCFFSVADELKKESEQAIQEKEQNQSLITYELGSIKETKVRGQDFLSERTLWLLELERKKYHTLSEMSGEIIFDYDVKSDTIQFSEKYAQVFGGRTQISSFREFWKNNKTITAEDKAYIQEKLKALNPQTTVFQTESLMKIVSGEWEWFSICVNALWSNIDETECVGYLGKITNINARKMETNRLREQANLDSLTGLYNKSATESLIKDTIMNGSHAHAFLIIDLDNFKTVNDTMGHLFGDAVLSDVASKIKSLFRSSDIIGRIGGDEFVVFLKHIPEKKFIIQKAQQLLALLQNSFTAPKSFSLSASIGISLYPEHGSDFQKLYHYADLALYQAKSEGKNRYEIFDPNMVGEYLSDIVERSAVGATIDSDKNSGNSDKQLVQYVFQVLYESEDIESAVNLILKIVGKKMNVSRAYIFEDSEDGRYCSNTFEWCNDDIEPEIHQLQNVSHADTKYYYNNFDENGILYCQNIKQLPAAQREVLEIQGIKALLQCAIRDKMEIKGFVGFDDCNVERFWTQEQIDVLMLISEILSVFLLKQRAQERMEKSVERMRAILDSQNSFICVLDCNTFELLYINQKIRNLIPAAELGMYCYEIFFSRSIPCEVCPVKNILAGNTWAVEIYNPGFNIRIMANATFLDWTGRKACLLTCHDSTPNQLEKSN